MTTSSQPRPTPRPKPTIKLGQTFGALAKIWADRATGFASAIQSGAMSRDYVLALLQSSVYRTPLTHHLSTDEQDRLAIHAEMALDDAIARPGLAAQHAIRTNLAPLLAARKPRAELLVMAYRAANGRIDSKTVETIVAEEIAAYLAQVHASGKLKNAG